jgi:hypothetical protein
MAKSREAPNPFNLIVGKSSYEDTVKEAKSRNWQYQEYEKKHFKPIGRKDPARGKNTFIKTIPKRLEGIRSIFLFFSVDSTLDALMVVLDPKLSDVVVQELDNKYQLVEKSLKGEKLSAPYPYALWQKGNVYIELQKPSAYRVRLLYVEKAVYPNYREFLNKSYPRYRHKELRHGWMDEL